MALDLLLKGMTMLKSPRGKNMKQQNGRKQADPGNGKVRKYDEASLSSGFVEVSEMETPSIIIEEEFKRSNEKLMEEIGKSLAVSMASRRPK